MNLQRLQRMSMPFFGYCKGGGGTQQESSISDSDSTSTYDARQGAAYDKLVEGAGGFYDQGPGAGNQQGIDFLNQNLESAAGGYQDALSGSQDRNALDQAKAANLDSAGISAGRALQGIGVASQGTGTAASGRRGIAEGVASADIYSSANRDNAALEADFQQSGLDRQMQAASGLSGMTGNIIGGMQEGDRQSDYERNLQHLLAYKDTVSGDMGGTTSDVGRSQTEVSGSALPKQSLI